MDLLAEMHRQCAEPDPSCVAFTRSFDFALLRSELDHFREWGHEALRGALAPSDRRVLEGSFDELAHRIAAMPRGFVHRDFQSRNLMWRNDSLVVIDFQDALFGPRAYDLVALLCDSYVSVDAELQERLLAHYVDRRKLSDAEGKSLGREFWEIAVQRKLKDAGRFVFIDRIRSNASFLKWYAPSFVYVDRALSRLPDFRELRELLRRTVPGYPDRVEPPASLRPSQP
jgi:aminoglycoside/choline kinase family phosphotransferase